MKEFLESLIKETAEQIKTTRALVGQRGDRFASELIKSQFNLLNRLIGEYKKQGGDISTLGVLPCPDPRQIRNSQGICVDDPGIGK